MGHIHSKEECTRALTGIGDALYVVGGKWKLRVVIALKSGNKRFNELQRTITGISARVLSHELRELDLSGNNITREGFDAIRRSPLGERLRRLDR